MVNDLADVSADIDVVKQSALIPMSLIQAVKSNLFNAKSGHFHDSRTGTEFSLGAAIKHGLLNVDRTLVRSSKYGEIMDFDDAVDKGFVDTKNCLIYNEDIQKWITFQCAIQENMILEVGMKSFCENDVQQRNSNGNLSCIPNSPDFHMLHFLDKKSGKTLCFNEAQNVGIVKIFSIENKSKTDLDIQGCFVKDSESQKWLSFYHACERGLVQNRNDRPKQTKQTKHVKFFDEEKRKMDMKAKSKRKHSIDLCASVDLPVMLVDVIESGLYDPANNTVKDIDTSEFVSFVEAIERGLVHNDSPVRDPVSRDILTLDEAIEKRIIDPLSGRMLLSSGLPIALNFALVKGLVVRCKTPFFLTLSEIIEEGLFDESTGLFIQPDTEEQIPLSTAVVTGMVDTNSIKVRNTETGDIHTFESAIDHDLINLSSNECMDFKSGEWVPLIDCVEKGILLDTTNQPKYGLLEFEEECVTEEAFIDPSTQYSMSLQGAMDACILDRDGVLVRDLKTKFFLTLDGAINEKLMDPVSGEYIYPNGKRLAFSEAVNKGLLIQNLGSADLNLVDAIHEGVYNSESGKFMDPRNGELLGMTEAIGNKLINCSDIVIKNSRFRKFSTVEEAVSLKILKLETSEICDENDIFIDLKTALNQGYIQQRSSFESVNLATALEKGMFSKDLKQFMDPVSRMYLPLSDALEINVIDPQRTLVKDSECDLYKPIATAIQEGIVDESDCSVLDTKSQLKVEISTAVSQKLLMEMPTHGFCLVDAVQFGLFQSSTNSFYHPWKQKCYGLQESISLGLIDEKQPQVLVVDKGILTVEDAMEQGILDKQTCIYQKRFTLPEAISKGLVFKVGQRTVQSIISVVQDLLKETNANSSARARYILDADSDILKRRGISKPLLGLQRAVEEGVFEKHCCKMFDPRIGSSVTLSEAVKTSLIHKTRSRILNPETKRFISLSEALERGIVSGKTGSILDRVHMKSYPLEKAVEERMVVDVLFSKVTLDEAVHYGLLNLTTLRVQSFYSDDRFTLTEAFENELLDVTNTLIKEPSGGTVMTLRQAVEMKVFHLNTGRLVSNDNKSYNILEALQQGYILNGRSFCEQLPTRPNALSSIAPMDFLPHTTDSRKTPQRRTSITFKEAVQRGLVDIERCMYNDISNSQNIPLTKAVDVGLVDISSQLFHDEFMNENIPLQEAIKKDLVSLNGSKTVNSKCFTLKEALKYKKLLDCNHQVTEPSVTIEVHNAENGPDHDLLSSSKSLSSSLDSILQSLKSSGNKFRIGTLHGALLNNLVDKDTGRIKDTVTGKQLTLVEAIQSSLIDGDAKEVVDDSTGEILSLENAMAAGVIDNTRGTYKDKMSLTDAFDKGLILERQPSDSEMASSVDSYVQEILLGDSSRGRDKIQKAFSSGVLNQAKSHVIDPDTIQPITLKKAASLGLIDLSTGEFKNPQSGESMAISDAMDKGFILSPKGLSLYSAVNQGHYKGELRKFVDPSTGKEHNLREMIDMEIVTPLCQEIKDLLHDGIIVTLQAAIDRKIIESDENVYINLLTNQMYDFNDAIAAGLIISNSPREGLRESDHAFTDIGARSLEQTRFRYMADTPFGPIMTRSFTLGNPLEGGSSSDLSTTDSSSTEKRDNPVFTIPLTSEMVRNIIATGKLKKDYPKPPKEALGDEVFSTENRVMEGDQTDKSGNKGFPEVNGSSVGAENHGKPSDKGKRWPVSGWTHKVLSLDSPHGLEQPSMKFFLVIC